MNLGIDSANLDRRRAQVEKERRQYALCCLTAVFIVGALAGMYAGAILGLKF